MDFAAIERELQKRERQRRALREASKKLLDHYVRLAASGDAGFWDPEIEPEVMAIRAALALGGDT